MSNEGQTQQPEIKIFEWADFKLACGKCGATTLIEPSVKGMRINDLYASSAANLTMTCPECGNYLKAYFEEAANPPIEDVEEITSDDMLQTDGSTSTDDPQDLGTAETGYGEEIVYESTPEELEGDVNNEESLPEEDKSKE